MLGQKLQKQTLASIAKINILPTKAKVAEESKALEFFINRLQDYQIVFSSDGKYYDIIKGEPHPRNEIACYFKQDYLNETAVYIGNGYLTEPVGSLTGKSLKVAIERFLSSAEEAFKKQIENSEIIGSVVEQKEFFRRLRASNEEKNSSDNEVKE